MRRAGARYVETIRLKMSRAPVAELAAAAIRALEDAGLDAQDADLIVVAVESGRADVVVADVLDVARLDGAPAPAPPSG